MAVLSRREFESGVSFKPTPRIVEPEVAKEIVDEKVPESKPKTDPNAPWFLLEHPDVTPSHRMNCLLKLELGERRVELKLEWGRVETQDVEARDALVKRGYRWMNEEF